MNNPYLNDSLEYLLSQLENAFYNAKTNYRQGNEKASEEAQEHRKLIKDAILEKFNRLEELKAASPLEEKRHEQ